MDEFMTPVFGKPWAPVAPATSFSAATSRLTADQATGLPVLGAGRRHGDVLGGAYAGGGRGSGALIPNQPVTGVLPARRQVLTS